MKYLICCLSLCCFVACTSQETEKPTLSDEKLARIMADLNIAEAATIGLAGYQKDSLLQTYITQVFEIHGTSIEVYEKDLRIVGADLKRLEGVVDASIELLGGKGE